MFLFRATHGKVLAGSSSFASQTTTAAAGRHVVSNPIRPSERYESTAASAHQSQSGTSGVLNKTSHRSRRICSQFTPRCENLQRAGHTVRLRQPPRLTWAVAVRGSACGNSQYAGPSPKRCPPSGRQHLGRRALIVRHQRTGAVCSGGSSVLMGRDGTPPIHYLVLSSPSTNRRISSCDPNRMNLRCSQRGSVMAAW